MPDELPAIVPVKCPHCGSEAKLPRPRTLKKLMRTVCFKCGQEFDGLDAFRAIMTAKAMKALDDKGIPRGLRRK
jgi:hypothetical protein